MLFTPVAAQTGGGNVQSEPKELISNIGEALLLRLNNVEKDAVNLRQIFRELLIPHFDIEVTSSWVLGTLWREALPEQKHRFTNSLTNYVTELYSPLLSGAAELSFRVEDIHDNGVNRSTVHTVLEFPPATKIRVNFRCFNRANTWRIIDVMVEGISAAKTLRTEFSSLQNLTIDLASERLEGRFTEEFDTAKGKDNEHTTY